MRLEAADGVRLLPAVLPWTPGRLCALGRDGALSLQLCGLSVGVGNRGGFGAVEGVILGSRSSGPGLRVALTELRPPTPRPGLGSGPWGPSTRPWHCECTAAPSPAHTPHPVLKVRIVHGSRKLLAGTAKDRSARWEHACPGFPPPVDPGLGHPLGLPVRPREVVVGKAEGARKGPWGRACKGRGSGPRWPHGVGVLWSLGWLWSLGYNGSHERFWW